MRLEVRTMHRLTAVFPQTVFYERTHKIIFDIPRNPQVIKQFKGHKKLVAENAVQLPLKHCQKKLTAAICQLY